jgi:hypothetical protein
LSAKVERVRDWKDAEITRLTKRLDGLEQRLRDEERRRFERRTYWMFAILWLEIAVVWALAIAKAAGA